MITNEDFPHLAILKLDQPFRTENRYKDGNEIVIRKESIRINNPLLDKNVRGYHPQIFPKTEGNISISSPTHPT